MSPQAWRAADALMFLLFAFSAAVQVNDPDPFRWMAIYGLAAAACALSFLRRAPPWLAGAVAAAALIWALTLAPRVLGRVPFGDMFSEFEMKDAGVEESREMYGLLIVAAWMVAVTVRAVRRERGHA